MQIETERLVLRPFETGDLPGFAALNADPLVRRHFPGVLTAEESSEQMERMQAGFARDGFAFAAVERREDGAFLGMAGLARFAGAGPLGPSVEIGWRFAAAYWGQGYATEAARGWLDWGFAQGLARIVAFTVAENHPSQAVMERVGMLRDPGLDFDHPKLPAGHPLRRHLVWRAEAPL
ncbi:MAG: GNAT family N-acetyltransferase [Paracoccaceae bacterium]|nr:GNAT family N-acetyltransferase [Paracoccaceae bacterium]